MGMALGMSQLLSHDLLDCLFRQLSQSTLLDTIYKMTQACHFFSSPSPSAAGRIKCRYQISTNLVASQSYYKYMGSFYTESGAG